MKVGERPSGATILCPEHVASQEPSELPMHPMLTFSTFETRRRELARTTRPVTPDSQRVSQKNERSLPMPKQQPTSREHFDTNTANANSRSFEAATLFS